MESSQSAKKIIKDIKQRTLRKFAQEGKIQIVLEGLRGEDSIVASWWSGEFYRSKINLSHYIRCIFFIT